ncbi:MAG: ABC transporter ATP-binding protein [Gammaproteobacteria bacterium]|nr:ABC transporter ATP-binding protein [Gammaproteobacteria bacterium]
MPESSFISIQGVSKHFGSIVAVDSVDLEIGKGEFFALLGPSGCGKTTLLRMLAGFEIPSQGEINIDGEQMSTVPPYQRPVNMVFQNYAIFPHLNVFQNIAFGLRKDRLPADELEKRVSDVLSLIKMEGFGERKPDELSGGQRQRVALARALIKKPKVLLLDEPLGALDKNLREQMQLELRQLQKIVGVTFVFVTHDQEEALTMSDRIAVMSAGKVLEVGSPEDLYEHPQTRFVADFLGTMNVFDGHIHARDGDSYIVDTRELGRISARIESQDFSKGEKMSVALRPENLQIVNSQSMTVMDGSISGVMSNTAYFGNSAQIYVELEGSDQPLVVSIQNLEGAASKAAHGNREVTIGWSKSSVLLLKDA